jgi:phosphoribosyl 1,2-cyclic phosphodiesterase
MELEFLGVRGSFPAAGIPVAFFGGNTPCAAVTSRNGDLLIVDAGTGIHTIGRRLAAQGGPGPKATVFMTHFHLDHVQGLPFFQPLFQADAEISFYAATEPTDTREHLGRLMGAPFFPLALKSTPARKCFKKIGKRGISIGSLRVSACPLSHPQGCVAYKFEEHGESVVFATDTEHPAEGVDGWLADFAAGASALIYDATFTPEEYASGKRGWGHSTWEEGTELARAAGVKRLLLSHHSYEHSDGLIRAIERQARKAFPATDCAREGMKIRF